MLENLKKTFKVKKELIKEKHKESFFVGIDEVGRGSWAGPLVVCCCWIDPKKINYD